MSQFINGASIADNFAGRFGIRRLVSWSCEDQGNGDYIAWGVAEFIEKDAEENEGSVMQPFAFDGLVYSPLFNVRWGGRIDWEASNPFTLASEAMMLAERLMSEDEVVEV